MRKMLLSSAVAVLLGGSPALTQTEAEENPTTVPQLAEPDGQDASLTTTEQLNSAMSRAFSSGGVQQLEVGDGGVMVFQAQGGVDRCDPAAGELSDFCRELLADRAAMQAAAAANESAPPEADFATAAPGNVDAFSVDPGATADQIGRGRPESLAAQAIGGGMFLPEDEDQAPPPEEALPPGLSPEMINGVNGLPPVITQGN